jgi:hypothetical protein
MYFIAPKYLHRRDIASPRHTTAPILPEPEHKPSFQRLKDPAYRNLDLDYDIPKTMES